MKQLTILLLCFSLIWASPLKETSSKLVPLKNSLSPRIVNGERARLGQFPWQAALTVSGTSGGWFCGGTIISNQWILTAGHCVKNAQSAVVSTGLIDLSNEGAVSRADTFILHEGYDENALANDIGLIKLSRPLEFDENTRAIDLASDELDAGVEVTVSGWGLTRDDSSSVSELLNYVVLTTISNSKCDELYENDSIRDEMVCAISEGRPVRSTCSGDSGGPMVINAESNNPVHVAVVSFVSDSGCESGDPSGYTRTSVYREWIRVSAGV